MTTSTGVRQQPTARLLVVEDEPNILELLGRGATFGFALPLSPEAIGHDGDAGS